MRPILASVDRMTFFKLLFVLSGAFKSIILQTLGDWWGTEGHMSDINGQSEEVPPATETNFERAVLKIYKNFDKSIFYVFRFRRWYRHRLCQPNIWLNYSETVKMCAFQIHFSMCLSVILATPFGRCRTFGNTDKTQKRMNCTKILQLTKKYSKLQYEKGERERHDSRFLIFEKALQKTGETRYLIYGYPLYQTRRFKLYVLCKV